MAVFPIQAAAGNPVGRSQTVAVSAIRRFSGQAANASTKLTTQERIVAPGDDTLGYSVSRNMRADIESLKVVSQTGQLNASALTLALAGLDSIKSQLDVLKSKIVEAQVADSTELDAIQAEIDLALSQIDSTANNTKLGSRSLLNGNSSIKAVRSIAANGTVTNISILQVGQSIGQTSGIQAVRVNKIGSGAPTRILTDGTQVLSLNVSVRSVDKNRRAFASITAIGAAAADFIELRVTGKLGSAVIRLNSTSGNLANLSGAANAFNKLASETGVVLTSQGTTATMGFLAIGFTKDDFVKLELLDGTGAWAVAGISATEAAGTSSTRFGVGTKVTVNGESVDLTGTWGTKANYRKNGYDIEFDFNTNSLTDTTTINSGRINIVLNQGVGGVLGTTGKTGDILKYGFGNFSTSELGRGQAINTVTTACVASAFFMTNNQSLGNTVLGDKSIAELGSGGRVALDTGDFTGALRVVDQAIDRVITEQTRLGVIQGAFLDAIARAETQIGNLNSADTDIIGVDATAEITNLIQAQLGVSTASSILAQANNIQATLASLLGR